MNYDIQSAPKYLLNNELTEKCTKSSKNPGGGVGLGTQIKAALKLKLIKTVFIKKPVAFQVLVLYILSCHALCLGMIGSCLLSYPVRHCRRHQCTILMILLCFSHTRILYH